MCVCVCVCVCVYWHIAVVAYSARTQIPSRVLTYTYHHPLAASLQTGIREVQSHYRMMKRELSGEKLLKSQVMKHFEKRCTTHFTPPPDRPEA